jgi:hypothetical protein
MCFFVFALVLTAVFYHFVFLRGHLDRWRRNSTTPNRLRHDGHETQSFFLPPPGARLIAMLNDGINKQQSQVLPMSEAAQLGNIRPPARALKSDKHT